MGSGPDPPRRRRASVRSTWRSCIDACERAFVAYSSGGAELPGVIHLDVPEAQRRDPREGRASPRRAVLRGEGGERLLRRGAAGDRRAGAWCSMRVTDRRRRSCSTAGTSPTCAPARPAASPPATSRRERVERVAVIGTGAQARQQLDALAEVRPGFTDVRVWGRDAEHASDVRPTTSRRGVGDGCAVDRRPTVGEAVEGADVVITCTAAREPLGRGGMARSRRARDGRRLRRAGKQELDPEILRRADVLVVDSRDQCAARRAAARARPGATERSSSARSARGGCRVAPRTDQLTVCDLTGVGVQDVAAANVVMAASGDGGDMIDAVTSRRRRADRAGEPRQRSRRGARRSLTARYRRRASGDPSIWVTRPPASSTTTWSAA